MRADLSDAPEWLRSRSKKGGMPALFPWILGVCVTLGGMHVANEAFLQKTVKSLEAQQLKTVPVAEITRAPAVKMTRDEWDKVVEEQAKRDAGLKEHVTKAAVAPGKGSVINKAYKPGEAINILTFNESYAPEVAKTKSKGVRVTVVSETKDSRCWPLKEGSVERRNCKFSQGLSR